MGPVDFFEKTELAGLAGLRPTAWLCVGAGFSREDVKELILSQGAGFVGDAITGLADIARKIVASQAGAIPADRVLTPLARQEVLRMLLANRRITEAAEGMPELKRLRRQAGFFRKLDFAIQSGRLAFAHAEEEQVYLERLGAREIRSEVRALAVAYEGWLRAMSLWDLPLLYEEATRILDEKRCSAPFGETIWILSNQFPESRERAFCDALGSQTRVLRIGEPEVRDPADDSNEWSWKRWHTADDAVEGLLDSLSGDLSENVILISDHAPLRRSLMRALTERGIPQADPRDPTRIRWDELIKWALLPLSVVASDFERSTVESWIGAFAGDGDTAAWIADIQVRGVRQGLQSYAGGLLATLYPKLDELKAKLAAKQSCSELAEAHLGILRSAIGNDPEKAWIAPFFERIWSEFSRDMELLAQADRRAPLRYWNERLRARVQESASPVEALKAVGGIQVYRLHQAPVRSFKKVWIFGLSADWLSGDVPGDYWLSERERETLGAEFAVRSTIQTRHERMAALRAWTAGAQSVCFFDAQYDHDGRERETLSALFREIGREIAPEECGAHRRFQKSYGALRALPPQSVKLPPLVPASKPEITATLLDRYSRCSFQALAYHRWKLRDSREPDSELWPEVRGNILHQAVKHLLGSRDGDGNFGMSCSDALERGWKEKPPRGLLRSRRVESYVKSRMVRVLETFCEKEREYFSRSRAGVVSLDDRSLRLEFPEFAIVGTPDRIDATDEALFIMDYKTSSAVPNGTAMLDYGYRLQLPFYAIAASRELGRPVAGVQFIELSRKASRGSGMFFKKYNGKEPGKFTSVTARSASLLQVEPEEAWARMEEQIRAQGAAWLEGKFEARPRRKDPKKECDSCQLGSLCGFRRKTEPDEPDSGGGA